MTLNHFLKFLAPLLNRHVDQLTNYNVFTKDHAYLLCMHLSLGDLLVRSRGLQSCIHGTISIQVM
jgi:hypothetical protein